MFLFSFSLEHPFPLFSLIIQSYDPLEIHFPHSIFHFDHSHLPLSLFHPLRLSFHSTVYSLFPRYSLFSSFFPSHSSSLSISSISIRWQIFLLFHRSLLSQVKHLDLLSSLHSIQLHFFNPPIMSVIHFQTDFIWVRKSSFIDSPSL